MEKKTSVLLKQIFTISTKFIAMERSVRSTSSTNKILQDRSKTLCLLSSKAKKEKTFTTVSFMNCGTWNSEEESKSRL